MLFLSWRLFCSCFSIQIWRNIFNFFSLFSGRRLHLVDVSGSAGSHPSRHSHVPNRSQPGTHSKYLLALSLLISFIYKSRYLPSLNKNQWLKLGFKVWALPNCNDCCVNLFPVFTSPEAVQVGDWQGLPGDQQTLPEPIWGLRRLGSLGKIWKYFVRSVYLNSLKRKYHKYLNVFLTSNSHTASEVKLPWLVNWTCM
jgi:hypothetical protein